MYNDVYMYIIFRTQPPDFPQSAASPEHFHQGIHHGPSAVARSSSGKELVEVGADLQNPGRREAPELSPREAWKNIEKPWTNHGTSPFLMWKITIFDG